RQRAAAVKDAAAYPTDVAVYAVADLAVAVADGQAAQTDGNVEPGSMRHYGEDAVVAARIAADGKPVRPRPSEGDVARQRWQGAGQVDRAGDAELDLVVAGLRVGLGDRLAQAGEAVAGNNRVVKGVDGQHRRRPAVLQRLQPQAHGRAPPVRGARLALHGSLQ